MQRLEEPEQRQQFKSSQDEVIFSDSLKNESEEHKHFILSDQMVHEPLVSDQRKAEQITGEQDLETYFLPEQINTLSAVSSGSKVWDWIEYQQLIIH